MAQEDRGSMQRYFWCTSQNHEIPRGLWWHPTLFPEHHISWYSYWYSYDLCKEAPGLAIRSPQMVLSDPTDPTQAPSNFTGRQGRCTRCLGTFWDWPRVSWLCQSTLAANRRLSCEKTHFSAFPRVNWGNRGNSPRIIWSFVLPSTLHSPRAVWNQSLSHGCWVTEDIATAGHHGIVLL